MSSVAYFMKTGESTGWSDSGERGRRLTYWRCVLLWAAQFAVRVLTLSLPVSQCAGTQCEIQSGESPGFCRNFRFGFESAGNSAFLCRHAGKMHMAAVAEFCKCGAGLPGSGRWCAASGADSEIVDSGSCEQTPRPAGTLLRSTKQLFHCRQSQNHDLQCGLIVIPDQQSVAVFNRQQTGWYSH